MYDAFLVSLTGSPLALYANSTGGRSTLNTQGGYSTANQQRWCINPTNGYLFYNDGAAIYTTNDISFATVTYVGQDNINANWIYQSTPVKGWGGYWYKTADANANYYCTVYKSDNTDNPINWTVTGGQVYQGGIYSGHSSLFFDSATSTMYLTCLFSVGGSYPGPFWVTQSSTDGVTWSATSNYKMAMTKNFT